MVTSPETITDVKGMILAAGKGTRLAPLTETLPKALVEIGGKPLIFYAVETLAASGIKNIIVNLHHHGQLLRDRLGDGKSLDVSICYSHEDPLLGSGGGIARARGFLGKSTFVTLNADTIVDINLRPVIEKHQQRKAVATLVLRKDPEMKKFGLIRTDGDDRVGQFLDCRRADVLGKLEPFMYTGVQVLEPRVFSYMPENTAFSMTELVYPNMLVAGEPIFGHRFEGPWATVGTPEELIAAEKFLRRAALDSPPPARIS